MGPQQMLTLIQRARVSATFDRVLFGSDDQKTEEVRSLTKLYRESWLIPPLDEVIAALESQLKKQRTRGTKRILKGRI